jgi:hypothetical protein
MKPTLYLETTIPSYLVGRPSRDLRIAADQQATHEWWTTHRLRFDLRISDFVLREISRGDEDMAAARRKLLIGLPVLSTSAATQELTNRLLRDAIIPSKAADDAAHLAIVAANSVEFLLTWNCTHINNRYAIRRIEAACAALGLKCPVICTPTELMNLNS